MHPSEISFGQGVSGVRRSLQLAVGSWQSAVRSSQSAISSWQSTVGNLHSAICGLQKVRLNILRYLLDMGVSGVRRSFQSAVGSPQLAVRNLQGVSGVVALCSWQSAVGKPFGHGGFKGEAQYSENHFGQRGFRGEAQPNP